MTAFLDEMVARYDAQVAAERERDRIDSRRYYRTHRHPRLRAEQDLMRSTGQRIITNWHEHGVTYEAIARAAGMSKGTVLTWRDGREGLRHRDSFARLSDAYLRFLEGA